ncbi:hypothetical protein COT72_02250 [archaeon CG10_big_fil_rev_8_21_14_0_10_43_11]|nr:MAG: hypothetical protein COT72_02250 [archaeon CG10_big_fil_rev_8_21_14_0_10_43_11]
MPAYILVHLNGLLLDVTKAYQDNVKLQWLALRQSNVKFSIAQEDYAALEKRIKPSILVNDSEGYWHKFWKHALIEIGLNPTPSVLDKTLAKFRTFMIHSSHLYTDVMPFLKQAKQQSIRVVLCEDSSKEYVNKALEQFGLKDAFYKTIIVEGFRRSQKEFYDQVFETLNITAKDALILSSRVDKDYALASDCHFETLLVLRRFFRSINTQKRTAQTQNAINLLHVLDDARITTTNESDTASEETDRFETIPSFEDAFKKLTMIDNEARADEHDNPADEKEEYDESFSAEFDTIGAHITQKKKKEKNEQNTENTALEEEFDEDYELALETLKTRML